MPKSIASHLSGSAAKYSKRALEAYAEDRIGDFVLLGGIAVEHAVKAKLARENSVFIAPDRKFRSAIALHNAADDVLRLGPGVATVGGATAIQRLIDLDPGSRTWLEPVQELIALRNGEAHLAVGDPTQTRRVFVVFLRAVHALLKIEPSEFWDPHFDLVATALDTHAKEIEHGAMAQIAAAKIEFSRRYGNLDGEMAVATLGIVETQRDAQVDDEENLAIDCPACSSPALAVGVTEQTDWDVDYSKDGLILGGWPILTFYASELRCDACGLLLEDSETIEAAGLESAWDNDVLDPSEWMQRNYDPDEDR